MKYTSLEREIVATGNGDLEMWNIRANDDDSLLASTHIEHFAHVIQQAIENDIEANEKSCWQ